MMKRMAAMVLAALCALALICPAAAESGGDVHLQRAREKLAAAGFVMDDGTYAAACAGYDEYLRMMAEYGFDVSYYQTEEQAAYMLLLQLGVGEYDDDAWAFTPTSDQIYVLDAEVFNVGGMYTEFLQGVQAIVDDAEFANVKEDLSGIDWEWDGSSMTDGHRIVAFTCNGTPYAIRLDSYGDWLNAEIIDFVNEALKAEGCRGQLHVISDGYDQMIFLIYGDEARAAALRAIIGTEPWEEPETEGFSLLDWLF